MGDRNVELVTAIDSARRAGAAEVVVVLNGAAPGPVEAALAVIDPAPVIVALADNVGIPAGRNAGTEAAAGPIVFHLDDDAEVASPGLVAEALAMFAADDRLGVVGFRLVDPETGTTARRHVPRLRAGDPAASGDATAFLGGACAIRRACFDDAGGYDPAFVYAMEETDLAMRAIDRGWRVAYRGDLVVHHPASEPTRHAQAVRRTACNRALLARKNLPAAIGPVYVTIWLLLTSFRQRSVAAVRAQLAGIGDGRRADVVRSPISWRTVWRLTRLGRPPVI